MIPGLTNELLERLIRIGRHEVFDELQRLLTDFPEARSGQLMRQPFQEWYEVARRYSRGEVTALIKALTVAERDLPDFCGGSVSPVISLYRYLLDSTRDDFTELRDWVVAHTQNHYLPFGSGRYRPASLTEYHRQVADHEARRRVREQTEEAALVARRAARKKEREEQQQARLHRQQSRSALIASLQPLSTAERLGHIIADTAHPVSFTRQSGPCWIRLRFRHCRRESALMPFSASRAVGKGFGRDSVNNSNNTPNDGAIETEAWLLRGNQHDSEASFVSHHPSVSFCSIRKRNGFDHRTDSLQGAEGKRVLRIYRRAGHCSRNRTHTKKEWNRIYLDWFISPSAGYNELAAWSKSSEKRRHGFTVCGCSHDQPGAAQGLKCGNWILSIAVNVVMCPELPGETLFFWAASDGCDLKTHASRKLNSEVTEPTDSLNSDELAGPSL